MAQRVGPKFETCMAKAFELAKSNGYIEDLIFHEIASEQIAHGDLTEAEKNKGKSCYPGKIAYEIASKYALQGKLGKASELMASVQRFTSSETQIMERASLLIMAGKVEEAVTELREHKTQLPLETFICTIVGWKQFETHPALAKEMVEWIPQGNWRYCLAALTVLRSHKGDISAKLDELHQAMSKVKDVDAKKTLDRSYFLLKAERGHFEEAFTHAKKNPGLMADLMDQAVRIKGAEVEQHLGVRREEFVFEKYISELARQGLFESAKKAEQQYQRISYIIGRPPYSPLLKGLVQGKHYSMALEVFKETPKSAINIRWGLEALIATKEYADAEKLISGSKVPCFSEARCWTRLAYALKTPQA